MRSPVRWSVPTAILVLAFAGGCLDFKVNNPVGLVETSGSTTGDTGTDEPPPPPPAPPGSVRIHFLTRAGGEKLGRHPGELNTNDAGETFFSSDLQYLVSDFRLVEQSPTRADYTAGIVHLVDAVTDQTGNTHFVTLENIPPGIYTTFRFRMGISEERQQTFDPERDVELDFGQFSLDFKLDRNDGRVDYFRHVGLNFSTFANFQVEMGPANGSDFSTEIEIDLGEGLVIEEETTAALDAILDVNNLLYEGNTALTFAQLAALRSSSESNVQTMLQQNIAASAWSVAVP